MRKTIAALILLSLALGACSSGSPDVHGKVQRDGTVTFPADAKLAGSRVGRAAADRTDLGVLVGSNTVLRI